jgi:hypothetical protein
MAIGPCEAARTSGDEAGRSHAGIYRKPGKMRVLGPDRAGKTRAGWGFTTTYVRHAAGVGLLAGGSLVVGALIAALQEPKHRAYAAALTGLSRA